MISQYSANTRDRTSRPHSGHEDIDIGHIGQYLFGCCLLVGFWVGRIFKLIEHETANLLGLFDSSFHPLACGCKHHLRTQKPYQFSSLHAHGLWHDDDGFEPQTCGDHGDGDTGVAAGWLHDGGFLVQFAILQSFLDHVKSDAIFDAAARVCKLAFGPDVRFDFQQRRVTD